MLKIIDIYYIKSTVSTFLFFGCLNAIIVSIVFFCGWLGLFFLVSFVLTLFCWYYEWWKVAGRILTILYKLTPFGKTENRNL